jgi:hypothetical protein
MQELSRLMYISSGAHKLSENELGKILEQSRSNNEKKRITGVLCVGGGHFVQVLEGRECDLIRLYCKIIDDPRHHDCVIIGIAPISERMFDQWSMGFVQKSSEDMALRRFQLLDYRLHKYQGDVIMSALKAFLNMLKEEN